MGSIKIAHKGTQNHSFSKAEFAKRYESAFGTTLPELS
jgi:adenosine kinase